MNHKVIFLLVTLVNLLPIKTIAFNYTYGGTNLNYEILDIITKTCRVGINQGITGDIVIPEIASDGITNYSVKEIAPRAFYCSEITSAIMASSITTINEGAFGGCRNLKSIVLSQNLTEICNFAFSGCEELTAVHLPNSVEKIGEGSFFRCDNLTTVILGNSVTEIGRECFYDCKSLISFDMPSSIISIGDYAFCGCSMLTSIIIPDSTKK